MTQYFNYPKSPKMNAYIEKTNDIIQQEFAKGHLYLIKEKDSLAKFNQKLMDWLIYYNTEREHSGLDYFTPIEYLEDYTRDNPEFKKRWTRTFV